MARDHRNSIYDTGKRHDQLPHFTESGDNNGSIYSNIGGHRSNTESLL